MTSLENRISSIGVVPVIKLNHPQRDAADLAKALCAGGVPVAEVTFRAAGAPDAIRIMKETCPDMLVGAGTVLSTEQVDEVIAAGGEFVVTPGLDVEIVQYCQEKGIAVFPGCTSATDYHTAYKLGLRVLKFFPAEQSGGLAKIKALATPLLHVQDHAHRRRVLEESEGLSLQPHHLRLWWVLHGHCRPDRQPEVGRDHRPVPAVRPDRKGGPQWLRS